MLNFKPSNLFCLRPWLEASNITSLIFSFLSLLMIYSSHSVDRKIHNIAQINESVKSLRSEFVDTRTILIKYKMESSVSKKINQLGIISSTEPPIKIIISK